MGRNYLTAVSTLLANDEQRARWGLGADEADAAVRSMRRQVQRYGDEAVAGLLSWAATDGERVHIRRALDRGVRVGTVVREWQERGSAGSR